MLAKATAAKAPHSIIPSIAMLMIPDRSQKMPEMAPMVRGVAAVSVLCNMPVRLRLVPLVTQTRNAKAIRKTAVQLSAA